MSKLPKIWLKKGKEIATSRHHHWIFSGAIRNIEKGISNGDLADVYSHNEIFLCRGMYHKASISFRILSFEERDIDQLFWKEKLDEAFLFRQHLGLPNPSTNIFRLFHGEGDEVPGLVIDVYANVAVLQLHYEGLEPFIPNIQKAINTLPLEIETIIVKKIYEKSPNSEDEELFVVAKEENIKFKIDVLRGQKTGFFIDQRENRKLLAQYANNKRVLNLFCYTGGFSLHALNGNAKQVDSIDISKTAIQTLNENLELNKIDIQTHNSMTEDVMLYIKDAVLDHDIIIVDPPAFAKHKSKRHNAIQAYKRLNLNVFEKAKSGVLVFTFSCSQVITKDIFKNTIYAAALESGRHIKILKELNQAPDHPVNLFHPESDYLKGLLLYLV